jgi:polyribonucleotide 5'-hydroxyl-kinase
VEHDNKITIALIKGTAEIFGCEMALHRKYNVDGANLAVYTWHGAIIDVSGPCHAYVAGETPMVTYLNCHAVFEERRVIARTTQAQGPRVLLAGPTDSGKSTLCKLWINYAVRRGHQPVFVDLDIGQGSITIPGMIAAAPIDRPVDVEDGFTNVVPLAYFYGHATPSENPKLFKAAVSNLAFQANRRLTQMRLAAESGMIINTCGWIDGLGYDLLLYQIKEFQADLIMVIDNDRLYNDLAAEMRTQPHIKVVKLPKSGGVVTRPQGYRRKSRTNKIREYFYGPSGNDLAPHATVVDFKDVFIFRVGGLAAAPASALPIGQLSSVDPTQLSEVVPTLDIKHSIIAVSYGTSPEALLTSNIAGFLLVQEVFMDKQKIQFLAPCPGSLPGKYLLLSSIKWLE